MKIETMGEGLVRGRIEARVPCIGGDHMHDIDIGDIYQAPQLHLEGHARCQQGHGMRLEQVESWEFLDDGDHGGRIILVGIFNCSECNTGDRRETLRLPAPDMTAANVTGTIGLSLDAATPHDESMTSVG
jgi:hypothetical protein